MTDARLETPAGADQFFRARGGEVETLRPIFTGDVFDAGGEFQCVVEHPCSLRVDGIQLKPTVLCAPVERVDKVRTDWSNESPRNFPLPDLLLDSETYVARLDNIVSLPAQTVEGSTRIASLTQFGVNLLQQRLSHYLTRVVIPTGTLDSAIAGEFEEADMTADWLAEFCPPELVAVAMVAFHDWVRATVSLDGDMSRQQALRDPQMRSTVRRQLVEEIRERHAA